VTDEHFKGWVTNHCEATAANAEAAASLLSPLNRAAFEEWGATPGELGECTSRLLRFLRVPKFANEHAEAVALQLLELRKERAASARLSPDRGPGAPDCALCRDTALVTVPHWLCVCVPADGPPYLTNFVDPRPGGVGDYGRLVCIDVRCTECQRGLGAKSRHPSLASYLRNFGGRISGRGVVALLAEHERAQADRARGGPRGAQDETWAALVARVRRRSAGEQTEAA
jgi:hypothetical protein